MTRTWKRMLAALSAMTLPLAASAADVGISVRIGQPGFFGRIDIGGAPPPVVILPEPIIIRRPPPNVRYAPVYLRVPPGHERNWARHCSRYNACGRPVYFVRDDWYEDVYVPHYRERHGPGPRGADRHERGPEPGHRRDHGPGGGHGRHSRD